MDFSGMNLPDLAALAGNPRQRHPNVDPRTMRKRELASFLASMSSDPTIRNLIEFIDILLQEDRESNDRCTVKTFLRNQGRIDAWDELKSAILVSYPTLKK